MKILTEKYNNLRPDPSFLNDPVILSSAWKKSHNYIRQHNWYADILELDSSVINLGSNISDLSTRLKNNEYRPSSLRLVPAPKSHEWYFPEGTDKWIPKKSENEKGQELRPLAHLNIEDQTVASAAMICLADAVETAQGPTEYSGYLDAQKRKVYSYGNRLHCEWLSHFNKKKQAKFNWGNAQSYRKYYIDYQTFLKRPYEVCRHHNDTVQFDEELFIVSIDLKKFYNNIDLTALINVLKDIYKSYCKEYSIQLENDYENFFKQLEQVFDWRWDSEDEQYISFFKNSNDDTNDNNDVVKYGLGLPQGLVSSGFFSNAYLTNFDQDMGNEIGKRNINQCIKVLDYCRYVDDIRITIKVKKDKEINDNNIEKLVISRITTILESYLEKIKAKSKISINGQKTKLIPFKQVSSEKNISSLMNSIQNRISGTPNADSLEQIAGELYGLLNSTNDLNRVNVSSNKLKLSNIFSTDTDIKDDTLKRFVATRLVKTLRNKRTMTVLGEEISWSEINNQPVTAEQIIDQQFEAAARKLISLWTDNPSLSLLLKVGLDLHPDFQLLDPVLDAIENKLYDENTPFKEKKTIEYLTADLLRAAAVNIGYGNEKIYSRNINLNIFRERICKFAKKVLKYHIPFPWYVQQQAVLYLITNQNLGFTFSMDVKELKHYKALYNSSIYKFDADEDISDLITYIIIFQQMNPNKEKAIAFLQEIFETLNISDKQKVIRILKETQPAFLEELIKREINKGASMRKLLSPQEVSYYTLKRENLKLTNFDKSPLLKVVYSLDNPFKQENAVLLLIKAILTNSDSIEILNNINAIDYLTISCRDWSDIQNPKNKDIDKFIEIKYDKKKKRNNSNLFPTWVDENYYWAYTLGTIIRSCLVGSRDYTEHTFLYRDDIDVYRGIKSTAVTRQFSLINQGSALMGEPLPITPWLTELLYKLLQWPGIDSFNSFIKDWDDVIDINDFHKLIKNRLDEQAVLYGDLSNTPMYKLPVPKNSEKESNNLRCAIVQTLMPQTTDFNQKDPTSWSVNFRAKHRDHLASMCELLIKQIKASNYVKKNINSSKGAIDVIIFPELSVHPDDLDILQRLSDSTGAHIFAGLTFTKLNSSDLVINQALWLIRTKTKSGRTLTPLYQGKYYMTTNEKKMKITSSRNYQLIINLQDGRDDINLTGAICYDATDMKLTADLRDISDVFIVAALNKDIQTFDNMIAYLHYHMFQPVILANTGEFGGSSVQVPLTRHERTVSHVHGNQQAIINIFELEPGIFKDVSKPKEIKNKKTPPAGFMGR
ncbi:RNA-directed DNA polymerase [Jeotgalibacillus aurantiacus]|uniref:RNA-directed DNA polymerase n=1 Tax=Jeotgalibacillus aurantiacus TaxID=2763266 RepID=UPI001D0A4E82|nr:RNA-directed DNA polymerase [Jeotgalibacillus aurantiacus]